MAIELVVVGVIIWITMIVGILLFITAMIDNNNNQEKLVRAQIQTNDLLADILNVLEYDIGDKIPNKNLKAPSYDEVVDYKMGG